jgi:UDP-glucose 4-epimerase
MMTIEDAVDLVLYSFEHARPGDLFVQKAPAATIGVLAEAIRRVFDSDIPINMIGVRHGEKLYETLLTAEEMDGAEDCGNYFRVPADNRDLNYSLYFSEGDQAAARSEEYHSHNTHRMSVEEMMEVLRGLEVVREGLQGKLPS